MTARYAVTAFGRAMLAQLEGKGTLDSWAEEKKRSRPKLTPAQRKARTRAVDRARLQRWRASRRAGQGG